MAITESRDHCDLAHNISNFDSSWQLLKRGHKILHLDQSLPTLFNFVLSPQLHVVNIPLLYFSCPNQSKFSTVYMYQYQGVELEQACESWERLGYFWIAYLKI